jgi:hypothetical protein
MEAPDMLQTAKSVQAIRAAVKRNIQWVDLKNAREIANSLGAGALMPQAAIDAVVKDVAKGMPAFEPQVFPFNIVDADTFDFFPSYALSQANGGPLPTGEQAALIGSHIRLTSSVFNSVPGLQAQVIIDFGPAALPGNVQTMLFELGKGTEPVIVSPIHGVIIAGRPRLQTRRITATAGAPVPGLNFPRIRVEGLPTALFQAAYRFLQPGDMPTDRFTALMAD